MSQHPDATRVAGYRTWQALGRQVTKGEKAIKIVVPMARKAADPETGEEEVRLRFGIGNVFDVRQTQGDPLPDVDVPVLKEDDGRELFDDMAHIAAKQDGLTVRLMMPNEIYGDRMGFYIPRTGEIAIRQAPQLQQTKTLAHEYAHHLIGHPETYHELRDEHETIAEAVAYVTLAHFGLDSGERSFPYVATWAKDRNALREVLGTIQGVSSALISRIEAQHGMPMAPADPTQ